MLHPDAIKQIPEWRARKWAQWERIKDRIPGLQLVRYGEQGTTHMLGCSRSTPEFYEALLIGRLPTVELRPARGPIPPKVVVKKPLVDLSDEQIDAVLERWAAGRTAVTLPFVAVVWGRDGRERTA